jgi:hypothetical protein
LKPPISENPPKSDKSPYGLNIIDLQAKLDLDDSNNMNIEDVRVRPGTYEAFVALTLQDSGEPVIAMFRVDETNVALNGGHYEVLALDKMAHTTAAIHDNPSRDDLWFNKAGDPVESYTVTDMNYHDGKLYATGVSSLKDASVMRVYDFPFTGEYKTVSIHTYNVSHKQWETRAPILNFLIDTVDLEQWGENGEKLGKEPTEVIVAALLCTPLAYLPLGLIEKSSDKAVVKSRAIAEIGDGGTPLGMFRFSSMGFGEKEPTEKVMVPMLYRNTKVIPWKTLVTAMNASPYGILCGKGGSPWVFDGFQNGDIAGMDFGIVGPYGRMTLMPDLSEGGSSRLVGLRRVIKTGQVELLSSLTTLDGTRLSDMTIEEYWWKSYVPDPNPFNQGVMNAQGASFKLEGYPDATPPLITEVTSDWPCDLPWDDEHERHLNVAARPFLG